MSNGDGPARRRADRALRRRIEERDDLVLADVAELASLAAEESSGGESEDAAQLESRRRLEQAEEAFSEFDYAGATSQLSEALELLRPFATRASGRQQLADIHLQLALVLHVHGERDAAVEELRTCRYLEETCRPDPAVHPPELTELYEEAAASGTVAELRIETEPAGAEIRVDGGEPVTSPTTFTAVGIGRHYVSLERDGFRPEVHVVNVASGEATARSFPLTLGTRRHRASATLRNLEAEGMGAEALWRAEATRLAGSDVLLLLRANPPGFELGAFDARGASLVSEGAPTLLSQIADDDAARGYLDRVLPAAEVPYYGQWWFWSPIAAGVAIGLSIISAAVFTTLDVRLVGGCVVREGVPCPEP